ncbi:MAG: Sapep family Mn(2+)-dependent dipeptidase [Oscillospiraceae bacterium]
MIDNELRAKVKAFVGENKENIVKDIKEIVSVKSVAEEPFEGAPFGKGPKAALERGLEMARRLGLETKDLDGYIGYAQLKGESDTYLATIGHLDVVPEGNGWKADPFTVRDIEGWLIGRGVADNKGACILTMYMLKFFKDNYPKLPYTLRALFGCDEETGMTDVAHYLAHEKAPAFAFTPDANFPVCCGEKGIVSFDLTSKKILGGNVVDFTAGVASNVVPDKAFITFKKSAGKFPACEGIDIAEGTEVVKLTANGKGGHAASPANTKNAIGMLVKYGLDNSLFSQEEKPYMEALMDLHKVTDGSGLGIDADDGLFDPLTCIGGMMKIEDGKFVQNINIRYPTNTDDVKIYGILKARFEAVGGSVPPTHGKAPFYIDPSNPVITALMDTYNELTNQDTKAYVIGGGTYARKFPLAVGFGIEPRGEVAPSFIGSAHGAEEGYSIDGFMSALEIIIMSMDKLLKLDF